MSLESTGYQVGHFTFMWFISSMTETPATIYPTGNATVAWKPAAGKTFRVKRLAVIGAWSAVGTGIRMKAIAYKGSIAAGNTNLSTPTQAPVDDPADMSFETTTPLHTDTEMDVITDADGLIISLAMTGGDTMVWSGLVIFEGQYL